MTKAHEYLTLRRAAHELFGWPDTRNSSLKLRRLIKRREKSTGKTILLRDAGGPFYVTVAVLKDHMPELFSRRDTAVALVKKKLEDMREDIAECKMRDKALARRIRNLESRRGAAVCQSG